MSTKINPNIVSNTNTNTVAQAMIRRNLQAQVRVDSHKQEVIHPTEPKRLLDVRA